MAGNVQDWKDRSIPTTFEQNVAAANPAFVKSFDKFDLANPHPGFGSDPNILNEMGHTVYPKMLYPNGRNLPGIVAEDEAQEREIMGTASVPSTLRQDGPTVEEFMATGHKAADYPPNGYAPKSSPEEVKAAIDRQNKPAW